MNVTLAKSLWVSLGVHLAVLAPIGLPVLGLRPATTDVERGVDSLEIVLVAPEPSMGAVPSPMASAPRTSGADHGAWWSHPPSLLQNAAPRYPVTARRLGWQGTVTVQAEVAPTGRATQVRVIRSAGFAVLDDAALAAIRQWQFLPATRGGRAVASRVQIPVVFQLADDETQGGNVHDRVARLDGDGRAARWPDVPPVRRGPHPRSHAVR